MKPAANLAINIPNTNKIGSKSDLNKQEVISICTASGANCNGIMSSQLKELASDTKIKVNGSVEIKPSEFSGGKWKQSTSFIRTINEIEKTGFGFFGAGAAATDCAVSYYPIKTISYNDFKIENTSSREAKINSCANQEHGMGGAIIIKWD